MSDEPLNEYKAANGISTYMPRDDIDVDHVVFNAHLDAYSPEDVKFCRALATDIWYYKYWQKVGSIKKVVEAGFFDDGGHNRSSGINDKVYLPLDKMFRHGNNRKTYNILVTTGGFSPIHNGHLEMMEQAKFIAESSGIEIHMGIIIPGHDSYVGQKYNGTAAISAADRCEMVRLAVEDSDWLVCGSFAALQYDREVNFTKIYSDVFYHVQTNVFVHADINVIYVAGEDNQAFGNIGIPMIIVPRDERSSSNVRNGKHDDLPDAVRTYYENIGKVNTADNLPYYIRDDIDLAISPTVRELLGDDVEKRIHQFRSTIRQAFIHAFKQDGNPRKVHFIDVKKQIEKAKEVIGDRKTISLDAMFSGDINFRCSRVFEKYGKQSKPIGYVADDGANVDLHLITGEYVLVDDDSVSGGTLENARNSFPNVTFTDTILLSDFAEHGSAYYDIVDLRDFLVGMKYGGLVVSVCENGRSYNERHLYIGPAVSLIDRARIPANQVEELTLSIIQANLDFYVGLEESFLQTTLLYLMELKNNILIRMGFGKP